MTTTQTSSPSFDHVAIPSLRAVLEGSILPLTHTLAACLAVTDDAVGKDYHNEDVPLRVWTARANNLHDAYEAHERGDNAEALAALRRVWSA